MKQICILVLLHAKKKRMKVKEGEKTKVKRLRKGKRKTENRGMFAVSAVFVKNRVLLYKNEDVSLVRWM
jgi:hypothetical protein